MRSFFCICIMSVFMSSCTSSTSVNYVTPKVNFLPSQDSDITNSTLLIAPIDDSVYYYNKLLSQFNTSIIDVATKSNDFAKIYHNLYQERTEGVTLDFTVDREYRVNIINKLLSTFTLGIIPNYTKVDYTFSCSLKKNKQTYKYDFVETTSTWSGLLVLGKERRKDYQDVYKELCNHIAQNLIEALRKQNIDFSSPE